MTAGLVSAFIEGRHPGELRVALPSLPDVSSFLD